jgi:hypothetical protein
LIARPKDDGRAKYTTALSAGAGAISWAKQNRKLKDVTAAVIKFFIAVNF